MNYTIKNNQVYLYLQDASGDKYILGTKSSMGLLSNSINKLLEIAKVVCKSDYKPASVTVSSGFISVTWDVSGLCGSIP